MRIFLVNHRQPNSRLCVESAGSGWQWHDAVTVSVGLAVTGVAGFAPGALIEAADAALYRAKANGRNRVEQYIAPLALEGAATSQSSKAAA